MSDEMFAARHLRYEIYEKKQIQPLLSQRRRSRSNRSESEHSLTASASANPRSPDMSAGIGSEAVGESVFGFPASDETPVTHSDAAIYQSPEPTLLPTVDVRLCRMSTSTLAALTRTSSVTTETSRTDIRTPATDICKDSLWPERSFPLVDADYDKLLASESSNDSRCHPFTSVSEGLTVSDGSSVSVAGPIVTYNREVTAVTSQPMVHSTPDVTPVTTL